MAWVKLPALYRLLVTALACSSVLFLLSLSPAPVQRSVLDTGPQVPPENYATTVPPITFNISVLNDKTPQEINSILESNNKIQPPLTPDQLMKNAKYAPFKSALNDTDRNILFDLVEQLARTCSTLNIVCMMYGGTLLGSYRHHELIPWDDDLDIFVSHFHRRLISRELQAISENYHVENSDLKIKFYSNEGTKTSKLPWKWPYIDISFFVENTTHIIDTARDMGKYTYPKSVIFPVHQRPLGHLLLDAPRDTFAALKLTYSSKHCQTYDYSHRMERAKKTKTKHEVGCHELADIYGFVHRSVLPNDSAVLEKLVRGGKVIHTKRVEEPPYAISKPYVLELL